MILNNFQNFSVINFQKSYNILKVQHFTLTPPPFPCHKTTNGLIWKNKAKINPVLHFPEEKDDIFEVAKGGVMENNTQNDKKSDKNECHFYYKYYRYF